MTTSIALFRGINVGGRHMLPMKDLRALLEKAGCTQVRTYIQSGNAVFCSPTAGAAFSQRLAGLIEKSHGFAPRILLLSRAELERAAAANPFPAAAENPKSVHLFFLAERPRKPDLAGLEACRARSEVFALDKTVFYLHTPEGFGTSKLAERAERLLGVAATARNWRTVTTLLEMARES